MTFRKDGCALQFPCECVSIRSGYSDPWAGVTQNKLLNDGTKERVLNALARQPKTIANLAKELGLSQPTIHSHVNSLLTSELLRHCAAQERRHPAENYYEPNFPVVTADDRALFELVCQAIAERVADVFESKQAQLRKTFAKTGLAEQGWEFSDIAQYCYASMQRGARELLEKRGVLPPRERHENGVEWLFWAEERDSGGTK